MATVPLILFVFSYLLILIFVNRHQKESNWSLNSSIVEKYSHCNISTTTLKFGDYVAPSKSWDHGNQHRGGRDGVGIGVVIKKRDDGWYVVIWRGWYKNVYRPDDLVLVDIKCIKQLLNHKGVIPYH